MLKAVSADRHKQNALAESGLVRRSFLPLKPKIRNPKNLPLLRKKMFQDTNWNVSELCFDNGGKSFITEVRFQVLTAASRKTTDRSLTAVLPTIRQTRATPNGATSHNRVNFRGLTRLDPFVYSTVNDLAFYKLLRMRQTTCLSLIYFSSPFSKTTCEISHYLHFLFWRGSQVPSALN
jgi:hypothetical protein